MGNPKRCIDLGDNIYGDLVSPERIKAAEELRPYSLEIEILQKCAGACAYCFASSTNFTDEVLPKEKIIELVDDGWEMGTRFLQWSGGDPLLHPDWYEISVYAKEKDFFTCLLTSSLVSKKDAKRLVNLNLDSIGIHLDTIHQETYNQVHTEPKTMSMKIEGIKNILEAGYPPKQIYALITMSKPSVSRIEETMDWYIDEMGIKQICLLPLKPQGFGDGQMNWEPRLSEMRRAHEYRAKRLGKEWLRLGALDAATPFCKTNVVINPNGNVIPCALLNELPVGNIYEEPLRKIVEDHRKELFFDFEVEGYCGSCENNDVCMGCRATAYHYTGNLKASDPKCFQNPDAKEAYCS